MNPITVGFLSQVERQDHAREITALQRLNQAAAKRPERMPRYRRPSHRMARGLARVLIGAGRRLYAWSARTDQKVPEPV